ncbi:Cytochrome P450 97B2 [Escovopsis weberi]|uniref:Cytochrome P450 97B2 n=1 Tax=Escovopsis weberi TaxID=150374 RepID=A0A0M8N5G9_ESCWE|nr:Cytochrome P450 97B2 [Escovopsis weberi]
MSTIALVAGGLVVWKLFSLWSSWQRNIAEAKKTGLPYVLSPDYFFETRCEWFDKWGDTTVIVSPQSLDVFTQNAEVIRQVSKRAEHFPKMKSMYDVLLQFGNNVVALEGPLWRVHRKATSASFNEKNTAFAFHESVHQARGMVRQWERRRGPITTLEEDAKRYALNVIGYVGFGIRLLWPGETMPERIEEWMEKFTSLEPRQGHTMSFVDSMSVMMENLIMLMAIPKWVFPLLPFRATREAFRAFRESMKYMNELLDERIRQIGDGSLPDKGMDVMGQLAKTSFGREGAKKEDAGSASGLSRSDILGNAVVMLIAGHETTAGTLHLMLILLAMNPSSQRRLQADVDRLVGAQDPGDWDYERLVGPMMASMLAACIHETLRVVSPASGLPKTVTEAGPQRITRDGASHELPAGCGVLLVSISAHVSPRYWPTERSRRHPGRADDLLDYVPERWFRGTLAGERERARAERREDEEEEKEDYGGWRGRDTNEHLFRPERGSYIPFADGPRACLGRRVAQVELVAALAVIFREYSVELAVDDCMGEGEGEGGGMTDKDKEMEEALEGMSRGARRALYGMARERAERVLQSLRFILAVRLPEGKFVPMRLVRRGEEKFVSWIDGDDE